MTDSLLDEVTNIIIYFSDSILEPTKKIKDQIFQSLVSYLGDKEPALYNLLENKINEILKIYTTDELDDLVEEIYSQIK